MPLTRPDRPQLTRVTIQDDDAQFLEFDALVSASHDGSAVITRHPVEAGSNVTDHIRREPDTLNVRGIVTDSPIIVDASANAQPSVPGGNPETRSADAYAFLRRIKDEGQTVKVTMRLRDYDNMAITSLSVTQDALTANIVDMGVVLEEVVIVETATTDAPEPVNPSRKRKEDTGKKTKNATSTAVADDSRSLLTELFSSFGG